MAIHTSQAPVEKKGDYGRQPNQTMVHQPTNATFSRTMIPTRNVCYHLEQGNLINLYFMFTIDSGFSNETQNCCLSPMVSALLSLSVIAKPAIVGQLLPNRVKTIYNCKTHLVTRDPPRLCSSADYYSAFVHTACYTLYTVCYTAAAIVYSF